MGSILDFEHLFRPSWNYSLLVCCCQEKVVLAFGGIESRRPCGG